MFIYYLDFTSTKLWNIYSTEVKKTTTNRNDLANLANEKGNLHIQQQQLYKHIIETSRKLLVPAFCSHA